MRRKRWILQSIVNTGLTKTVAGTVSGFGTVSGSYAIPINAKFPSGRESNRQHPERGVRIERRIRPGVVVDRLGTYLFEEVLSDQSLIPACIRPKRLIPDAVEQTVRLLPAARIVDYTHELIDHLAVGNSRCDEQQQLTDMSKHEWFIVAGELRANAPWPKIMDASTAVSTPLSEPS